MQGLLWRRVWSVLRYPLGLFAERVDAAHAYRLERNNRDLREQLMVARSEVAVIRAELELQAASLERFRTALNADIAVLAMQQASGQRAAR